MGGTEDNAYEVAAREDAAQSSLGICLVSGGMDSCVTAAIAQTENDQLAFLHVSYGQRTEHRERRAFEQLADHFRVAFRFSCFRLNI